jgi:hypothetical protein
MKYVKTILAVFAFAAFTVVSAAHAQETPSCTNATIIGDYAFTITGQILAPTAAVGPVTGVALSHFDGETNAEGRGLMTQVDHVVHNGAVPAEEWRPGSGPYQVNPDCTGWMTITPEPTIPSDGGAELTLYFVIGDNGNTIHTVVSQPKTSPLAANITSSATRVRQAGFSFPRALQPAPIR